MSLHIRRIDKARDFMALRPLWSKLACESGQVSPFLSHDWFWCCWHGVWPKYRPEILLVEEAGNPIAIIPLMHWRERLRGLPVRCIGFLEYVNTPMVDLVTVAEHSMVIEAFLDYLSDRADWDIAWLQKLPGASPTVKALEGILPKRLPWRHAGKLFSPYIAIEGDWQSFMGSQMQLVKNTYSRVRDQLEDAGALALEEHRALDPWSPYLYEALQVIRYNHEKDSVVVGATVTRIAEFFRELTRRATRNGWLSLWTLRLDGRIIAIEYQLHMDGKVQTLWTDEDPAYREFSPSSILQLAVLQALFEHRCIHEYSSSPTVRDEQLWWASGHREMVHLKLYRPGLYSHLLQWLEVTSAHEQKYD
jgi:hypothetical protein